MRSHELSAAKAGRRLKFVDGETNVVGEDEYARCDLADRKAAVVAALLT
jgi:hypothetical protein